MEIFRNSLKAFWLFSLTIGFNLLIYVKIWCGQYSSQTGFLDVDRRWIFGNAATSARSSFEAERGRSFHFSCFIHLPFVAVLPRSQDLYRVREENKQKYRIPKARFIAEKGQTSINKQGR